MTPQDFTALLNCIRENNSWGVNMYDVNVIRKRRAIKYVDASFDSRDGRIWQITFRSCVPDGDRSFRIESQHDIDSIYSWLNATI